MSADYSSRLQLRGMYEVERYYARSADGRYGATIVIFREKPKRGKGLACQPVGVSQARTIDGLRCTVHADGMVTVLPESGGNGMTLRRVQQSH